MPIVPYSSPLVLPGRLIPVVLGGAAAGLPDIEQVGSVQNYPISNSANTGTISSVDVPATTELVLVGVPCYHTDPREHTSKAIVYMAKGGVDSPLSPLGTASDASNGAYQGAMYYMVNPDVGASNYIKWDWGGAGTVADAQHSWSVTFWKGVDTTNPIRSSGGDQRGSSGFPATTPTLDAETGDLIVAHVGGFNSSGTPSFDTWSNLTALGSAHKSITSAGQWATNSPSGDVAVAVSSGTNIIEPNIMAGVLRKPYSRGTTSIVQAGSTVNISGGFTNANSGTVSTTISVPADAEIVLVGYSGYDTNANTFSGGTVTFTKGGVDTAMTSAGAGDTATNATQGGLWYLVLPDTGTNKSLKFDWAGSSNIASSNNTWSITFWKGINTALPVRSSGGNNSINSPVATSTLTAQDGDLLVEFSTYFIFETAISTRQVAWRDAVQFDTMLTVGAYAGAWAKVAPTADMPAVVTSGVNADGFSIFGVVLKPTEGIEPAGYPVTFSSASSSNTGTVSSTIVVPPETDLIIVAFSGYHSSANLFSGGTVTFTKGGVDTAMTSAGSQGDSNAAIWNCAMWYMASPDTGSNMTLKYDWAGSGTSSDDTRHFSITFWKGVNTSDPVRDSDGVQDDSYPLATPTLTAQTGDKIVAFHAGTNGSADGSGVVTGWTNLTTFHEAPHQNLSEISWGTSDPTGNVAVGVTSGTNLNCRAMMAIVLKPAV